MIFSSLPPFCLPQIQTRWDVGSAPEGGSHRESFGPLERDVPCKLPFGSSLVPSPLITSHFSSISRILSVKDPREWSVVGGAVWSSCLSHRH